MRERDHRDQVDEQVLSVYRDLGVVPKAERDDNFNKTPEDLSNYKLVLVGDVVVNKMKAWQGSVGVSRYRGIVSGDYLVCAVTGDVDRSFLHYLLRSRPLIAEYAARAKGVRPTQWRIYWDDFADIPVTTPSLETQRRIAAFLDAETARIDALIEKKRRMIGLLELRVQAEVRRALLGGLHGADPTAVGEPRDDFWWSLVPPHNWTVARLVDTVDLTNGFPFDSERFSNTEGFPLIRIRDLLAGQTATFFNGEVPKSVIVEDGDLVVGMDGDFNAAIWNGGRAALNQRLCRLRARPPLRKGFLRHVVALPLSFINALTFATTVKHLASGDLLHQRIPLPPEPIQDEIVAHLDRKVSGTAVARARLDEQIALLMEHRRALVTAAVTGELDLEKAA